MTGLRTWLTAIVFAVVATGAVAQEPERLDLPVLMQADEISYDKDLGLVVAKGNVEIMQGERILLADAVSYNQRTDTVTPPLEWIERSGVVGFRTFVESAPIPEPSTGLLTCLGLLLLGRIRRCGWLNR